MSLVAAVVAICAVGILAVGFITPVRVGAATMTNVSAVPTSGGPSARNPSQDGTDDALVSLSELQQVCAIELRRPLYDPPTPEQPAASPEAPTATTRPLPVRLVGTVIEAGHSMAMLQKSDGSIVLGAVDQSIEDAGSQITVISVQHDRVTVQYAGTEHELILPPRE